MVFLKDMLEEVLKNLENSVGNISISAIVSRDGLLMVSRTPQDSDSEAFAALTATVFMSAESTSKRLSHELPNYVVIETDNNYLITNAAGPAALIIAMASKEGGLGLILTELKKAAEKVKELV